MTTGLGATLSRTAVAAALVLTVGTWVKPELARAGHGDGSSHRAAARAGHELPIERRHWGVGGHRRRSPIGGGTRPLSFNEVRFARLSVAEQIFVLSNLERTTRGLYPAVAMTKRLDTIAARAALHDGDPVDVGRAYSSIWSSAPSSFGQYAFFADFGWMYDDGPPPQYIFRNVDCTQVGQGVLGSSQQHPL